MRFVYQRIQKIKDYDPLCYRVEWRMSVGYRLWPRFQTANATSQEFQNWMRIIFTHNHADHTAGLDDTRPFTNRNGVLPIYAKEDVIADLESQI